MKTVLVTGSSQGIGYSIALKFLENGYFVIFNGKKEQDLKENIITNNFNYKHQKNYECYIFDVSKKNEVKTAILDIVKKYHKIDVLINNAGIALDKTFLKLDDDMWQKVLDTNLNGAYNVCKCVLPLMCENSFGRIINITSVVALSGNFGQTNYAASKAGLIGLTKSLAIEVAKKNITVNAIAPGFIKTNMTKKLSSENLERIISQIPMGEMGEPEDVANLAFFLANDGAKYITGETISVNGGYYLK